MATNIRFLYTNLIDMSNTGLTASSQATTMPVENLLNPLKCIPWRTAGTAFEYADIDLGQAYLAQGFAAAGHNYTENAEIVLCGDNSETFYQPVDSNHIGFWKFNGSCEDSSGSENHLTAVGIESSDYYPARQDRAAVLDGTEDYFYVPATEAEDFNFSEGQDFSIEMWLKPASISNALLIFKWDETSGYYLELQPDGKLHFMASDGTNSDEITGFTVLEAGSWYFVTVTADRDGELNIYLNGQVDTSPVVMTTGSLVNTADLNIGTNGTIFYNSAIGFVAISNAARTTSYIQDAYATPKLIHLVNYSESCLIECFDPIYLRYWRYILSDPDNPIPYLDTGRIFIGEWFEPSRNFHGNWIKKIIDPSSITTTLNNIEFSDVRTKYIEIDLSFPKEVQIPQDDAEKYEEMFAYLGAHKRLFVALDYKNQPRKWTYYGTLTGERYLSHLSGTSHTDGRWTMNGLKFKESR